MRDKDGIDEAFEVNAIISAVGLLNRPSVPHIEGLDSFAGAWFHSSRWDHDIDLEGRRVAVVGTGASAMQFAPAIAADVDRLLIFQRSRHWVMPNPRYHRAVSDGEKWLFRHVPFYAGWYRFLQFWNSADRMYPAFRVDPDWETPDVSISLPNEKMRRIMTAHLTAELADTPELVEQVLPDYPPLGKRILQDNAWFRTLLRDNVTLVNDRITRVTEHSVVSSSGEEYDVDTIVFATGFHPNKFLWPMDLTARGARLHDVWGEDPRAYLGITVPGFPNLFCLYGPNTNPVVGSVIFMLECQVNYVMRCLGALIEGGYSSMECRQDVHDEYNDPGRRRTRAPGLASPEGSQLLQQQPGPRHDERAMATRRLLAHDQTPRSRGLCVAGAGMRLAGKTAIITGGGSGFGRATAIRFAAEGARIAIADIDEEGGATTAEFVKAAGSEAEVVVGDISTAPAAERVVVRTLERFGAVHVLVNNAGISRNRPDGHLERDPGHLGSRRPGEPQERLPLLSGHDPVAPRRRRRCDRQRRVHLRFGLHRRFCLRGEQGCDPQLHPPRRGRARRSQCSCELRLAWIHADADVDR